MEEKKNFWQKYKTAVVAILAGLFVASIWIWGWKNQDQYSKVFENINVLFSGLAFAVLIITVLMQKEELELQRKELTETRGVFQQQNETMKRQQFESSFFQMLFAHHEMVRAFDFVKDLGEPIVGKDVFRTYFFQLKSQVESEIFKPALTRFNEGGIKEELPMGTVKISISEMVKCYEGIFDVRESDLSVYFLSLYQVFKYVEDSSITDKEKYTKIVRSQLSSFELTFLFYNGLSKYGKNFKDKYLEPYSVLENMTWKYIFNHEHLLEYAHLKDSYISYKKTIL
jgi:hypothetical protein